MTHNIPRQYRQGDLLFEEIIDTSEWTKSLEGARELTDGIIARGEATGHQHRLDPLDLEQGKAKVYFLEEPRRIIVEAFESIKVLHEEHHAITLEPGWYQVIPQQEEPPWGRSYVRD